MIASVALLAGVLLGLGAAGNPGAGWLAAAVIAAIAILSTPWRHRVALRIAAFTLAGMALASLSIREWSALRVVPVSGDSRALLEGVVLDVPAMAGGEVRFDAEVTFTQGPVADGRPRRARLAWRDPPWAPRVGERWRWLVRLESGTVTRNFVGPDPERIAFRDRIHVHARVLPSVFDERLLLANASIDTARARVGARIADQVDDPDAAALITALAVGLTDGMSADQWRVFNATGTTHLVAISGTHVTMFALLAFWIARMLWRWLPFAKTVDREPFALTLGLAAAGAYSMLAGFSVPTQRTWLMLAIFALSRVCARHVGAGRIWSLALIAVLILDPFAPLAAGFWLSFVAVGVILLVEGTSLAPASRRWSALRLQLAVMLALAPLTFAVFGGVSVSGLWVNLVAIPVVSFVLVPIILAGALMALFLPIASGPFFHLAGILYEWLWPGLTFAANLEYAQWRVAPPGWWFAFAAPACLLVLRRWPWRIRVTALLALLPLWFAPSRMPREGEARVSVIDAGRGVVALVATHSHVLVFDTGDTWGTRGSRMKQLVLPALDALSRQSVDRVILPSLGDDRAVGAALLASERNVSALRVGGGWPAPRLPATRCMDERFRWDGVDFATFAAGGGRYCVLRISAGDHAMLLGGDLDAAAERALVATAPPGALSSDAVLMSRKASSLSSDARWIEAISPGLAIAAGGVAGSDSRESTESRWRRAGARILDTRDDGAIDLGIGTSGVTVIATARGARYPFAWRRP